MKKLFFITIPILNGLMFSGEDQGKINKAFQNYIFSLQGKVFKTDSITLTVTPSEQDIPDTIFVTRDQSQDDCNNLLISVTEYLQNVRNLPSGAVLLNNRKSYIYTDKDFLNYKNMIQASLEKKIDQQKAIIFWKPFLQNNSKKSLYHF